MKKRPVSATLPGVFYACSTLFFSIPAKRFITVAFDYECGR